MYTIRTYIYSVLLGLAVLAFLIMAFSGGVIGGLIGTIPVMLAAILRVMAQTRDAARSSLIQLRMLNGEQVYEDNYSE